jgi:predicted MFS family arabinose efflux permease
MAPVRTQGAGYKIVTPDYFGENYNASNYGVVCSAKVASSLVGIGVGASVIHSMGWTAAYLIGAGLALASAALTLLLRQPQEPPEPDVEVRRSVEPAGVAVQTT